MRDEVKPGRGFVRWTTKQAKDGTDRIVRLWSFKGWKKVGDERTK